MKDSRKANVVLGIKILRTPRGLMLNQSHYLNGILEKFGHLNYSPMFTPYNYKIHIKKNKDMLVTQIEYVRVIRSMNYLLNCTHFDIACATSRLNTFSNIHLEKNKDVLMAQIEYAKAIESMNHLSNCTCFDIACVVGRLNTCRLSRYMLNPNQAH